MSPRSLLSIILKIMGVYLIKEVLVMIPSFLSAIFYFKSGQSQEAIWILVSSAVTVAVYFIVIIYLVLKTDWIIDRLELDKGFREETLSINFHRSTVLFMVLQVAGILILTTSLPLLIRAINNYFQEKRLTYGMTAADPSYMIVYGAQIVIAIILMVYARTFVNLIEKNRR